MGTTCGRTTLIPNYTRITTRDAHTTGITDIEFTTGTIAIITIAIEPSGWRSLSKRFFTEVHPRKDHRGVDLISDALYSAGCGTPSRVMQSITLGFSAAPTML
jgi:hypothetical protein